MTTVELTRQLNACEAVLDLLEPWIEQAEGHYNVLTDKNQEIVRTFRKARPKPLPPQDDDPPPSMLKYCREDALKKRRRTQSEDIDANAGIEIGTEIAIETDIKDDDVEPVDFSDLEREAEKLLENM